MCRDGRPTAGHAGARAESACCASRDFVMFTLHDMSPDRLPGHCWAENGAAFTRAPFVPLSQDGQSYWVRYALRRRFFACALNTSLSHGDRRAMRRDREGGRGPARVRFHRSNFAHAGVKPQRWTHNGASTPMTASCAYLDFNERLIFTFSA